MDEGVYIPCENYPDNFIDQLFDMSNLNFEQTEDGSIVVNGYSIITTAVDGPLPVIIV